MAISKKTLIIQLALLSLFVLSSYAVRKSTVNQLIRQLPATKISTTATVDPFLNGICSANDRDHNKMCPMYISQGCTCYTNGTCVEGWVNKCTDCIRPDVFAVIQGQECPERFPGFCPPKNNDIMMMCLAVAYPSCVCTTDGKCEMRETNSCSACQLDDVVAVFEKQSCPVASLF